MPPKGKKKGPPKVDAPEPPYEKPEPTEKELKLKAQLEMITEQLKSMRNEVEELRQENEFLQQESQQIKVETHEYLGYISKKTQKRQAAVITLSDRNAEKIREIQTKKEEVLENFEIKKEDLAKIILTKESELIGIQAELDELSDYQILQNEQQREISQLEKRVNEMRTKHNEAVQKLKTQFLEEKNYFEDESELQLKELGKEAKKEANHCLHQHAIKVRLENRSLRKELLYVIQRTRALHKRKQELEDQKKVLLRQQEYADSFRRLKRERNKKMYEGYGLDVNHQIDAS